MVGGAKFDPWFIIRAQQATYIDARTGRQRWQDALSFYGVPALVFGVCYWQGVALGPVASGALLTATGLLGALLFGVMLQVSDRAMTWADSEPEPSVDTSDHAAFLRELAANAGYASLVCIVAAVAYVVCATQVPDPTKGEQAGLALRVASAFGLALGSHLVLVLLMVMKRVFALTDERLTRARAGARPRVVSSRSRRAS
jgi:hypothetical protein